MDRCIFEGAAYQNWGGIGSTRVAEVLQFEDFVLNMLKYTYDLVVLKYQAAGNG